MSGPSDEYERKEQEQRAQSWYAIVGFGVLVAAVAVILQWMPENPFSQPSETPHTTRLNAGALTGRDAPMLAVTPSQRAAIAPGCRVSDVALVQEWRGAFRLTNTEALLAYASRARRGRFTADGWGADTPGDGGAGCVVVFRAHVGGRAKEARWTVSEDRTVISPANEFARELAAMLPSAAR
ncbi:MAG: hypothetical protein EPO40_24800 [Myxococcaceae bacterium]|nr:MAG: hypothetical protein EPO40_24800 [Myxococcaceae bacterium]